MHDVLSSNCFFFLCDIFTFFFSARDTNEIKQLDTYSEYSLDELW